MAVQELRIALGLLGSGGSGCICPEGSAAAWPRRCRASVISFTLSHMIDLFGCNDAMSALGVRGPHPGRRCLLVAEWTLGGAASLCGIDSARRLGYLCPPAARRALFTAVWLQHLWTVPWAHESVRCSSLD